MAQLKLAHLIRSRSNWEIQFLYASWRGQRIVLKARQACVWQNRRPTTCQKAPSTRREIYTQICSLWLEPWRERPCSCFLFLLVSSPTHQRNGPECPESSLPQIHRTEKGDLTMFITSTSYIGTCCRSAPLLLGMLLCPFLFSHA